jgi:hypothetical protein
MASYPKDIFDDLPEDLVRVGAHRAPKKRGGGWIGLAWAALATGVLVVGGLYGLSLINPDVSFDIPGVAVDEPEETPTPTATPTAEPITDPTLIDPARGISITVLNGTATPGLQNTAGDSLAALAWPVGSRAPATASDIETTYIYYSDPLNEDVARGVALALGIGEVRESTAFLGAPITVVLGADYVPTP